MADFWTSNCSDLLKKTERSLIPIYRILKILNYCIFYLSSLNFINDYRGQLVKDYPSLTLVLGSSSEYATISVRVILSPIKGYLQF